VADDGLWFSFAFGGSDHPKNKLVVVKHTLTKLFRATHGAVMRLFKIRHIWYFTKQRDTIKRGWKTHFTWFPSNTI